MKIKVKQKHPCAWCVDQIDAGTMAIKQTVQIDDVDRIDWLHMECFLAPQAAGKCVVALGMFGQLNPMHNHYRGTLRSAARDTRRTDIVTTKGRRK